MTVDEVLEVVVHMKGAEQARVPKLRSHVNPKDLFSLDRRSVSDSPSRADTAEIPGEPARIRMRTVLLDELGGRSQ
jgi:hypothetical protein